MDHNNRIHHQKQDAEIARLKDQVHNLEALIRLTNPDLAHLKVSKQPCVICHQTYLVDDRFHEGKDSSEYLICQCSNVCRNCISKPCDDISRCLFSEDIIKYKVASCRSVCCSTHYNQYMARIKPRCTSQPTWNHDSYYCPDCHRLLDNIELHKNFIKRNTK